MRRIGIDARLYSQTGVGVYLRNFLHYLQKLQTSDTEFYIYILEEDVGHVKFSNPSFIQRTVHHRWHTLAEQTGFLRRLLDDNLDLVHFTYFSYPIFYRRKFIATIHDTTLLNYKTGKASTRNPIAYEFKFKAAKLAFTHQVHNAAKIITPTQTVKQDLVKTFGTRYESKIFPIYEGVNYELFRETEDKSLSEKFKKDTYFLYVGNFYPHKNVERLIRAFPQIKTDKKLVLAGPEDFFMNRMKQLTTDTGQTDKIIFFSKPTNSQLIFLYKHALALVHPSLTEGFCLPLVEAAHFKLPVIGSDIPVFREVIGDDYLAFDPHQEVDMVLKMSQFLKTKKHTVPRLSPKFSFAKMAEDILALYQTI